MRITNGEAYARRVAGKTMPFSTWFKATVRLNVSIGGGGVELLATGPKWYDTRKEQGGGAIDLTMHLFRLSFVDAVKRLSP
uniref:Uncharacterized protein n=2 Tax=Citrobacter freundii TaxID=546 RepID=A0A3Q9VXJ5_CITFR|nr:Hypothetical protein [Citrobacter freundii]